MRKLVTASAVFLAFLSFAISAEFWGSTESNKYHYPTCRCAENIKPENLTVFNSPEEAQQAGYVPCKVCNPPASGNNTQNTSQVLIYSKNYHLCCRVVDGDTIVVDIDGVCEKVRLVGVDTPETVHPNKPVEHYGKEASAFTRNMVEGEMVRLEYDTQRRDRYGRLLAYVYLPDGTFLNAEIIKQGYGFAYTRFPFKYMDQFRQYERSARESGAGLWAK